MLNLKVLATGKALPANTVTADMLDQRFNKAPGYTFKKSGVALRYFADGRLSQSELGAQALQHAVNRAGIAAHSIDLLISACGVQEQPLPSTACAIAAHAKLKDGTPAFDVNASCLSFLTALNLAGSLLHTGVHKRIAIVSVDLPSRGLDWDEPEASLIFGDGAAAVVLEKGSATQGVRSFLFKTFVAGRKYCEIRAGGTRGNPQTGAKDKDYLFSMDGKQVLKMALQKMPAFVEELLDRGHTTRDDVGLIVPHQASHLGMTSMIKRLGFDEQRVVNIYETHGNQVAASMPTALHEAYVTDRIQSGNRILFLGTAAGLSLGGMLLDV